MEQKRIYEQIGVAMTSRSYIEYERMFVLNTEALKGKSVLDVAGGASSFTAEARKKGIFAEAADPMYHQSSGLLPCTCYLYTLLQQIMSPAEKSAPSFSCPA